MEKTILIVEDDAFVREILRDVLRTDYRILEASRCSEAANYLDNPLDLAIIDYMLPDCDGFDLAKALREKNPGLPIILITAYNHRDTVMRALRSGLTDYINKPLNLRYLKRKVSQILEGKHLNADGANEVVGKRQEFIMDGMGEYMEKNFRKDLTLDKLAKLAGMSRSNFCRAFRERFGKSFIPSLNCIRIEKSVELLKNPSLNITEIALFVGYGSVEYFGRIFRTFKGISPKEYRNRLKASK